jgi:NAD(P)-dependent dehydrogenase (short-subunit alcohol dehydrogenase family)
MRGVVEVAIGKASTRFCAALALCALVLAPTGVALAAGKTTVLITGANRGIGLALAQKFQQEGFQVIGTARKPAAAAELSRLGVRVEQLDVADTNSAQALAASLEGVGVDILINNAGIIGHSAKSFPELDVDKLDRVFNVNTLGPLRVTQALLPNLQAGAGKTVITISSVMGSIEANTWRCCIGYRASKAAINSANKTLSLEYGQAGYIFVVLHPGYVKTDMNDGEGHFTTRESAAGLFSVIDGLQREDNGRFYDLHGKTLPW